MSKILVIGDTHFPWVRKGYLEFCMDLYEQWDCNKVIHIGDVVDFHAISFHAKEPSAPGPHLEYKQAKEVVQKWYEKFPEVIITAGNHDKRAIRRAKSVDIPEMFLKSYSDLWDTPKWKWVDDIVIDDIYFYHGTGQGGKYPASNAVSKMLMSVVMGHNHRASGVKFYANPLKRVFSCDVGSGVDDKTLAFNYSTDLKQKSIISAAVIVDGTPYVEPMPLGKGEKYNAKKFKSGD